MGAAAAGAALPLLTTRLVTFISGASAESSDEGKFVRCSSLPKCANAPHAASVQNINHGLFKIGLFLRKFLRLAPFVVCSRIIAYNDKYENNHQIRLC
jgi:hypothetical protein